MTDRRTCVVVGAGLAGLRAAESLVRRGFQGTVTVLGDESVPPYSRPPLSKDVLAGDEGLDVPVLRTRGYPSVTWYLGTHVVSANLAESVVTASDYRQFRFDGLVVATGVRPRRLTVPGPHAGRVALRTLDDLRHLRTAMETTNRVAVIGAGFLGCEVASTLARKGVYVDVVMREHAPMASALGGLVGEAMQQRLERQGVRFHRGEVLAYEGTLGVEAVALSTGVSLPASVVVEAIGSEPNGEWLSGNALDLTDGVRCMPDLRVDGAERVVACGDIAAVRDLATGAWTRVEHWLTASDTGTIAGATLARLMNGSPLPVAPRLLPSFWSDQAGIRIQGLGLPRNGVGDVRVLEGHVDGRAVVGYHHADGSLAGVVLLDAGERHQHYRGLMLAA